MVRSNVTGMVIKITALALNERRKIIATMIASSNPIHKLSVTLRMESVTKFACM